MFAQVVLGLPVEGPFDYFIPDDLRGKLKTGMRVEVNFRYKKEIGYVVGIAKETKIAKTKPILRILDDSALLNKNMLLLTRELSQYYCCSWGEAIETALPQDLRRTKFLSRISRVNPSAISENPAQKSLLIHDMQGKRWDIYLENIKQSLKDNRPVIVLLPDINAIPLAKELIVQRIGCRTAFLYRNMPGERDEWIKVKEGLIDVVIGTRSAVFAPLENTGLIIIDEEHSSVYKQDQVPHYHARQVAFMRAKIDGAGVILASASPTLESYHSAVKKNIEYLLIPRETKFPEIKTLNQENMFLSKKRVSILSKYVQDSMAAALNSQGKALLFLNRRGFATGASCQTCGKTLKCPRCNINLIYFFHEGILSCHYCSFKMKPPSICPACNSGYIKYSGYGTEKIESELARIFPQARIKQIDNNQQIKQSDADIFISTSAVIKHADLNFDLIVILAIDNSLNRMDLRSSEKTFEILVGLLGLTQKCLIIQTALPGHHIFKAIQEKTLSYFYEEELKQRKQLDFPPYSHLCLVKLRGPKEEKVKESGSRLYDELSKNKIKGIKLVSLNPGQPPKLRGNYYWQILLIGLKPKTISKFLKSNLKNFPSSGIIITVDMDPL